MGSEKFLGREIARGINKAYDMVENNKWPKIGMEQVKDYFTSEEFLGTAGYLWLEMRKAGKK
jgi:hypothetical protein